MKTLIIHPKDSTTDFLRPSYNLDATIIRTELSDSTLIKLIRQHDLIIMMGHGTEQGLIGFGRTYIGSEFVAELRKKTLVCIWCHASDFVKKYNLKTLFSTGMFISEMDEAYLEGIGTITFDHHIQDSNWFFIEALESAFISSDLIKLKDIQADYEIGLQEQDNPVISFNTKLFYSNL